MRLQSSTLGAFAIGGLVSVSANSLYSGVGDVAVRALPNAPDGYAPSDVDCPSTRPKVREAATLSKSEKDWRKERRNKTINAMTDFFGHVSIDDFDAEAYIKKHSKNQTNLPNVGIAVSGGGYRALMNGAGAIKAFDSRTDNSTSEGHLGGLLQTSTYLSGLSGGGWLVGSLYINNDSTVTQLQRGNGGSVWEFSQSILEGPTDGGIQLLDSAEYYKEVFDTVTSKSDAGYQTSITDIWGRALSYQLINAPDGAPGYTFSSIALDPKFQNGDVPMPILVADGRNPGEKFIGGNATVFEFNPFEFGTFDPTVFGFVPLEYLGSNFEAGLLPKDESCVRGYDNAGFIMGTSSSLFNQFALQLDTVDMPDFVKDKIRDILESIGDENNDIAEYKPNPFYHYSNDSSPFADHKSLAVVDGGEDLQNIPFHPLIQPEREVDVIFAIDSSADNENNWPNGTAMVATYERSLNSSGIGNGTSFPAIPDQNTFVNLGLNSRPTFFGCDSSNTTNPTPLVVYIPNSPIVALSNVTTFTLEYKQKLRDAIIQNGYDVATQGNGTLDSKWSTCVGCAMLSRSFERTETDVPDACSECFKEYCWDGTLNSTKPDTYAPSLALDAIDVAEEDAAFALRGSGMMSAISAAVATLLTLALW